MKNLYVQLKHSFPTPLLSLSTGNHCPEVICNPYVCVLYFSTSAYTRETILTFLLKFPWVTADSNEQFLLVLVLLDLFVTECSLIKIIYYHSDFIDIEIPRLSS